MPVIRLETFMRAPVEACFDAARDIDLHAAAGGVLPHRPVAGVTSGLIELGEEVTWASSFFGVPVRMTSRIIAFERPRTFTDEMRRGPFKRWRHTHIFEPRGAGTLVRDHVEFASPLCPLGTAFDALYLRSFMERVLAAHNASLKAAVERRLHGADPSRPAPEAARLAPDMLSEKR
jgi:ligand-binding SRPBCC domain-containing protein